MLTLNGKFALGHSASGSFKNIEGTMVSVQGSAILNTVRLRVGTGTTAATVNDYAIETPDTSLSVSGDNYSKPSAYGDDYIGMVTATFQNTTDNDIVVSELGLLGTTNYNVLIAREVINPVTIPANGGTKTFTISIG